MKIKELCELLSRDEEEKMVFFLDLEEPKFLNYFDKYDVISFTDKAGYYCIKYLNRIINETNKSTIIQIINKHIRDIESLDYSSFYILIELISKLDIVDDIEEKIDYSYLFSNLNSIQFSEILLKDEKILLTKNLSKKAVENILEYKIVEKFGNKKEVLSKSDNYHLSKILNSEKSKALLKILVQREDIFNFLITCFTKSYEETIENKNTISDIWIRQTIEKNKYSKDRESSNSKKLIHNIIIDLLMDSLQTDSKKIKILIESDIFMLKKLGLYLSSKNTNYIELIKHFLEQINETNVKEITNICLYEIVQILKIYSEDKCDELNEEIKKYLNHLKFNEKTRYDVLHGLKNHTKFRDEFKLNKELFKYERDTPGIYITSGASGWVVDIAPVSADEFNKKDINEVIEYLNSNIEYNRAFKQIDDNHIEEVNADGLAKLFKETAKTTINEYLENPQITTLKNLTFINAFIDLMREEIKNINIDLAYDFINNTIDNLHNKEGNTYGFYDAIISFNSAVIRKDKNYGDKALNVINKLFQEESLKKENYPNEIEFDAINTLSGKNWETFIKLICTEYKPNEIYTEILKSELNSDAITTENQFFFYHLGYYFDYINRTNIDYTMLLEKVLSFNENQQKIFLEGYLRICKFIDYLIELEPILINNFQNYLINTELRNRLVQLITSVRFAHQQKKIFETYQSLFCTEDYKSTLNMISSTSKEYDKTDVFEYWDLLLNNKNLNAYSNELLEVFNKYADSSDIRNKKDELIMLLKSLCTSEHENYCEFIFEDFIDLIIKHISTEENPIVFDIIDKLIDIFPNIKYLYSLPSKIVEVCQKLVEKKQEKNAELIANKFNEIPSLKIFLKQFKEFLQT